MSALAESLTPGTIIQDTYRIDHLLGEGGMGATFAGYNIASGHPVAIKVISAAFAANSRATDLFRREANLLRTIQHEAVVRYETTLRDSDGRLYLVMEMLPGQPLSHYVSRGARLGPLDTLKLGRRLAGGLDAIASVDIVHRDVAPDNIFVPEDDIVRAKLIDFGLASNTVGTEKSILGDSFAGKFSYSAPEQFGLFEGRIGPWTDAYSLGLVLMKVAGLPVPGEGQGMAAGAARRDDIDIPADRVGAPLATVLAALLKADPTQRPSPLVPVFEEGLRQLGIEAARSAKTEVAVERIERRSARNRKPLVAAAAAVLLVAAGIGTYAVLPQADAGAGGGSSEQIAMAKDAVAQTDPFAEIDRMIAAGSEDELNAAFGALKAIGDDAARPDKIRIAAYRRAAGMVDPEHHDAATSPFREPVPSLARRLYGAAAELGSEESARAEARLEE